MSRGRRPHHHSTQGRRDRDEVRKSGLYDQIWQAFAVLLPVPTVGVMGEGRTYNSVCALRAVTSVDPQAWLADVLSSIVDTPQSRLRELVPWNWKTSRLSRAA